MPISPLAKKIFDLNLEGLRNEVSEGRISLGKVTKVCKEIFSVKNSIYTSQDILARLRISLDAKVRYYKNHRCLKWFHIVLPRIFKIKTNLDRAETLIKEIEPTVPKDPIRRPPPPRRRPIQNIEINKQEEQIERPPNPLVNPPPMPKLFRISSLGSSSSETTQANSSSFMPNTFRRIPLSPSFKIFTFHGDVNKEKMTLSQRGFNHVFHLVKTLPPDPIPIPAEDPLVPPIILRDLDPNTMTQEHLKKVIDEICAHGEREKILITSEGHDIIKTVVIGLALKLGVPWALAKYWANQIYEVINNDVTMHLTQIAIFKAFSRQMTPPTSWINLIEWIKPSISQQEYHLTPIPLPAEIKGRLTASRMPHAYRGDLDVLKASEINHVFMLNHPDEALRDNQGIHLGDCYREISIECHNHPIKDFGVPKFCDLVRIVDAIEQLLKRGKNVLVHCKGGVGRTGLILAACLIKLCKWNDWDALHRLRELIPHAVEVKDQYTMLLDYYHLTNGEPLKFYSLDE